MYAHSAWFDELYPIKEETEETPAEVKELTYEQELVQSYYKTLTYRKDIKDISFQEAQYEKHLITWEQYEQHIKDNTRTYPFKSE
jgi:hypothetical protein